MKRIIALLLLAPSAGFADAVSQSGNPIGTNRMELVWTVPSNHWPSTLWIYKVVPQNIAPPVISNLMAVGSFTKADRGKPYKRPPFKDDGLLFFRNKEDTRHLGISPYLGWIDYRDEQARAERKVHPEGVPSEEQAYSMALEFLRSFGIDRSQLATKGNTSDLRTYKDFRRKGWFDKSQNKEMEEITSRGVYFIRRIDGIDFSGIGPLGGVYISFGNGGKLTDLNIIWKGLEPFELHNTLTAEQMLEAIREGKTKWASSLPSRNGIKKITITEVMTFYRGGAGDSERKFIEPFTLLATSVDYGTTNVIANLECQILGARVQIQSKEK